MGAMVQDMKAHKAVNDTKGSGGLKCCTTCKNMLNKAHEEIAGPYFKHYALADASECTGAVFDEHCQKIFSPVTHQYEDSMHTFYASCGIASCMQKSLVRSRL